MKPRTRIARSTKPIKRSRLRPKKRKPSEYARIYGSRERVQFIKSLPCCACGVVGYSENAHIETGGMGRKADADMIVPLCGFYQALHGGQHLYAGCHAVLHQHGRGFLEGWLGIDLSRLAAEVQRQWEDSQ